MKLSKHILFLAISLPTIANAAFPEGQWRVDVFHDGGTHIYNSANGNPAFYRICIEPGNNFHAETNPTWKGKWFMKGNDIHLISLHSSGQYLFSLEVSKIHSKLLSGYSQWAEYLTPGEPGRFDFDTTLVSFQGACTF